MSKTSSRVREERLARLIEAARPKRAALKEELRQHYKSLETAGEKAYEKVLASINKVQTKLDRLSRDTSAKRLRNRCRLTGRARGYLRKFGLCRHEFRRLVLDGKVPGMMKSSW
jgi:small subunit ribosomal protein S14